MLIVFDDMIADMINNKRLNCLLEAENSIFLLSLLLNHTSDVPKVPKVPKDVRLNSTHVFIMKIPNKRELQQIAMNHSSDFDFKDFIKIYKKCTTEPYLFLVNDTTLPSDNTLKFRRNLLK